MRILIIEDNPDIVANLYGFFEPLGYELDNARDGVSGLRLAESNTYDCVILDIMLPGIGGVQVCRNLREKAHSSIPILMLTARDTLEDKVTGFDAGADDYLVKPFSLVELEARVKALIRRSKPTQYGSVIKFGPLRLNSQTREVFRDDHPLALTPIGYQILEALMRAAPSIVGRDELEHDIWRESPPDSDAMRTHIHLLRQSVDKPFDTPMLQTVRGIGYRLVNPDDH